MEKTLRRSRMLGFFGAALAIGVIAAGLQACGHVEDDGPTSTSQAVKSDACPGLLTAYANVCPDKAGCQSIKDQLVAHGCELPGQCPCQPGTWWYYPDYNGVYCFAPDYGRLSVCSPGGQEICVANYGTQYAVEVDPAMCQGCRAQFPVQADWVSGSGTVTVSSCVDIQ